MRINGFAKLINKYKWNSVLLRTLLISFVFIFIPIVSVGSLIFFHSLQNSKKQMEAFANDSHNALQNTWKNVNDNIYNLHVLTTSQDLINDFLFMSPDRITQEQTQSFIAVGWILKNYVSASSYTDSAYLYSQSSHYVLSASGGCDEKMFWDTGWISKISSKNYYGFVRNVDNGGNQLQYITILKPFFGFENCFAVYNINYHALLHDVSSTYTSAKHIYIITPDQKIIFSLDSNDLGKDVPDMDVLCCSDSSDIRITGTDEYGYTLLTVFESRSGMTLKNYSVTLLLLILLLLVMSLFASFYITSSFYRSIRDIILQIPQDITSFDEKRATNEFNFITSAVSSLVRKNSEFEQELAMQLTKMRNAQLIALQEQINPHFLFNTLNIISLLDLQNNSPDHNINKVVILLSDILRYILGTDKYLVPLNEELEYLKKFMELQSIRYDNKFRTEWDIAPDTGKLYVVKFSLQPIVENAIMHGFIKRNEANRILIHASQHDDFLKVAITNNGEIIEPSRLAQIQNRLKDENMILSDHIGLFNTNTRYKLLFGKAYSCIITSDTVSGTTVTLWIPKTDHLI